MRSRNRWPARLPCDLPHISRKSQDREGKSAPLSPEIVGQQRIGRGDEGRLPHANPDPRQRQTDRTRCKTGGNRRRAPQDASRRDDPHTRRAICQPREGHTQHHVKQHEGGTHQHAHHRVTDAELSLDRADQTGDQVAVGIVDDVDRQQHRQHDPRVGGRAHLCQSRSSEPPLTCHS